MSAEEALSRRDRRIKEQLDSGEPLLASATFNTGSIAKTAWSAMTTAMANTKIVRLAVTDRRLILFATSNFAFNLNLGDLVGSVPYTEIGSIESSAFRVVGIKALRLRLILRDDSVLSFEASGLTVAGAKRLVPILEKAVVLRRGDTSG